ncbi:MAG: hypothetical protein DHS20C02_01620 [Micavibrio sp.]|nr:MAG: hypothetical protein DHS20C02_01620 [Micavibrio sp.]
MSDENYEERFHELTTFVEDALTKVKSNEMPDLSNLDERVSGLCSDIEAADDETTARVQPMMAEMIGKLDELALALSEYQQKLQSDPES